MSDTSWIWGVVLSLAGCTLSNFGVNLQKFSHMKLAAAQVLDPTKTVYTLPHWIGGLSLVIIGSLMDLVSFGFADISLLAPLGAMTLVINMLVAPCFLHETLTRRDIVLTIVILFGTVFSIAFGSKDSPSYSIQQLTELYAATAFIVYLVLMGCVFLAIAINLQLIAKRARIGHPRAYDARIEAFTWPYLAGAMGAHSVLFAKSAAEVVKETAKGNNQFTNALSYFFVIFMLICVVTQVRFLNVGLSKADALFIVPVYQVCWVIMNTIVGMIYFQDYASMSGGELAGFFIGVAITIVGVYLLSQRTGTNAAAAAGIARDGEDGTIDANGNGTPSIPGTTRSSPGMTPGSGSHLKRSSTALGHIPAFGLFDFGEVHDDNKREISRLSVNGSGAGATLSDRDPDLELNDPTTGDGEAVVCTCTQTIHDQQTNQLCICVDGCTHARGGAAANGDSADAAGGDGGAPFGNDLPAAPIAVVRARGTPAAPFAAASATAAPVADDVAVAVPESGALPR